MKNISIDNGMSYTDIRTAIETVGMNIIAIMMDDEIREAVANKYAPCSNYKFVKEYLKRANEDLIIG